MDITRPDIKLETPNIEDTNLIDLSLEDVKGIRQIKTGKVEVLPKNSVSLDDIDPYNLPDSQNIIIEPEKKEMVMVGRRVNKKSKNFKKQRVGREIFEELSEEEISQKYTYFFDSYVKYRSPGERVTYYLRAMVIFLVLFIWFDSASELGHSKERALLFERQEMGQLEKFLKENEEKAGISLRKLFGEVEEKESLKDAVFEFYLSDLDEVK